MVGLIALLVVIGIILIVSILILIGGIKTKEWFLIIYGSIFLITYSVLGIAIISDLILETKNVQPEPTTLDAYRRLTELEITTVNGVPKDTVVVYKNK